jgi:hypothetical protein
MNRFTSLTSAFVLTLSMAASASAGILTATPGSKMIEGVKIAQSGTVLIDGNNVAVTTVGAGLRTKHVLIAKVKVYVATLMATDPTAFARKDGKALDSIASQKGAVVQLAFLRGVDAATVQSSFKEALQANNVSLNKSEINALMKAVASSGDASDGKTLTFATSSSATGDTVVYEGTHGAATVIRGPLGFARDVMSIWLGTPSDDGIAELKAQLLQPL